KNWKRKEKLLSTIRKLYSVDYFDYSALFYQTRRPTGEYLFDYNGNELFHVDLDSKSVVWTLPGLSEHESFDPQGALQDINVARYNLDIGIKRSNSTAATNKHDVPTPTSEAYQNVICALGLAVGIIGIIAGVMLIIKGMKQSAAQGRSQR
uniref:Major histocompatibility complex, class II, DQ alpha 1 n=1 Tax=Xenopus tropicalis TaxID=8364 RepID=A0A803KGE7_XENTR